MIMPAIRKSADLLSNFDEIREFCQNYKEPIFLTNDGQGELAVMSIETYEEITGIRNLINLLEEADSDIENGNFLTEEEMNRRLDLL
jgi:PHD/YefM family antitoxin component YafN of YafNO toxin-antitoxin module